MRDLIELAKCCEAADPAMQGALIEEAWTAIHHSGYPPEGDWDTCEKCHTFQHMLEARAYESAALMLVPDGWRPYFADMSIENRVRWLLVGTKTKWSVDEDGDRCAGNDWYAQSVATTPALAITAACCRAIAGEGE